MTEGGRLWLRLKQSKTKSVSFTGLEANLCLLPEHQIGPHRPPASGPAPNRQYGSRSTTRKGQTRHALPCERECGWGVKFSLPCPCQFSPHLSSQSLPPSNLHPLAPSSSPNITPVTLITSIPFQLGLPGHPVRRGRARGGLAVPPAVPTGDEDTDFHLLQNDPVL